MSEREMRGVSERTARSAMRPEATADARATARSAMTPESRRRDRKTAIAFGVFAAFCVLLARVYALYSHGVDSAYMTYAFCYPLIGGAAVYLGLLALPRLSPGRLPYMAYNAGVITLTLGSILAGVFEIAGTASRYQIVYSVTGWALVLVGIIGMLVAFLRRRNPTSAISRDRRDRAPHRP